MRRALAVVLPVFGAGCLCVAFDRAVREAAIPAALEAPPEASSVVLGRDGTELAVASPRGARDCRPLPIERLGRWLPLATVEIEDRRFHSHHGVDPIAIARSLVHALRGGRIEGASTITQQLIKLADGRRTRSWSDKAKEALAALALERRWSKQRILEEYLNRLDYGQGRTGAEAAARHFFGKPAAELNAAEAIYLAGLPQAPSRFARDAGAAAARFARNARLLAGRGVVPPEAASARPIPVGGKTQPARVFARLARGQPHGSMATGLDAGVQSAIERILFLHGAMNRPGVAAVAVVVDNTSGLVRAMASSDGVVDPSTLRRSCGSTLKPFVYLRAFDRGVLTAATMLSDDPESIPYDDYRPRNYSAVVRGRVTAREALACSLNAPAIHVLARAGARDCFQWLRWWGFDFAEGFDSAGAGFVLGNVGVTPVELAGAYASLARGGLAWPAAFATRPPARVAEPASRAACALVADILADNQARSRSFGAGSPLALPFRAAAKTGTSSGFRDGWCAGFDGTHTVVVWAGRPDGRPLGEVLAIRSAAPLWAAIMRHLHATGSKPLPETQSSDGLVRAPGADGREEWFLAGFAVEPEPKPALEIRHPRAGAVFEISRVLSPERQRVVPTASRPDADWWLDDRPVPAEGFALEPGQHVLVARSGGEEARIAFSVEPAGH